MEEIRDTTTLRDWLNGQPVTFASTLAVRIALRIVPVLEIALHEDNENRRGTIILPSFRALAASSYAGAWPSQAGFAGRVARVARQELATISSLAYSAQKNLIDALEAIPDFPEEVARYENEANMLGVVECAVHSTMKATDAVVAMVDEISGIGSSAAAIEATVCVAKNAHAAIDGVNDYTVLIDAWENDEPEDSVPPHIEEFWTAVALDVEWLRSNIKVEALPEKIVIGLGEQKLWLGNTPVWASNRWNDFKDKLPESEGWQVWVDWYEARLAGRQLDLELTTDLLKISDEDWIRGPKHANAVIAKLIESRSDPILTALARGFEDLGAVKKVSSIDLTEHSERIRNSLPNDPHQVIGATKDMLEATMKTILDGRGKGPTGNIGFPELTTMCLTELQLIGTSAPANKGEQYSRKIASNAKKMLEATNELRNHAGTGHGRVVGKESIITLADAQLVASTGLILAAWLLRNNEKC